MTPDPEEVLQEIYEHFRQTGDWPSVRDLQVRYKDHGDFRTFAARLGQDRLVCQQGPTGVCYLPLREVSRRRNSLKDIALLCGALEFASSWFAERGPQGISQADLAAALDLHGSSLRGLGRLLQLENFVFSGGGSSTADMNTFSLVPTERALFFDGLRSFLDYEARVAKIRSEERERDRIQRRAQAGTDDYALETIVPAPMPPALPVLSRWSRLNDWLHVEAKVRGPLWVVVGFIISIAIALLALL